MALGFLSRLTQGLSRSAGKLTEGIGAVFTKRKLDDEALEDLENLLISADLGTEVAQRIIAHFRSSRFGKEVSEDEVKQALAEEIAEIVGISPGNVTTRMNRIKNQLQREFARLNPSRETS